MDNQITFLLGSMRPQDRKKAIHMLTKVGDQEALRALAGLYKNDPDAEIRELAVKAGKYIKREQNRIQETSAAAPRIVETAPEVEDEAVEEPEEEYIPIVVSGSRQSQAKGLMDRALDLSMHGDKDKAIDSISKAFKLNPNLRLDSYYMGVAMDITGMDQASTIRLVTVDETGGKARNKEKRKNDSSGNSEDVTWETALIDLALYYTVIAGIGIVSAIMIAQAISSGMASMPRSSYNMQTIQSLQAFNNVSIVVSVMYGLIGALFNVGFLVIFFGVMHMIATMMFGGEGTFRGLIHRGSMPLIVSNAVMGSIGLFTLYVSIREVFNPANLNRTMQTLSALENPLFSLLNLVSVGVTIGCLVWFVNRIGENYKFGWGRGCLTYIVSLIAGMMSICGCYFFVLSALFRR
jgi:hypothetical protein